MTASENIRTTAFQLEVPYEPGYVSVEIYEPANSFCVLTLGHGAGSNMSHTSMKSLAMALALEGIITVRYNFPYSEKGKKMPDRLPATTGTIKLLCEELTRRYPGYPLFGGGKSFGGRMTSNMQALHNLSYLKGIIFYGFPLHPSDKPGIERADHLKQVTVPLLFLTGTADTLAYTDLIRKVCQLLPNAELTLLEGVDHSFAKAQKRTQELLTSLSVDWLRRQMNG